MKNFRKKVDAGANAAITQYFCNADAYFRFVDECRTAGIGIPIVPGLHVYTLNQAALTTTIRERLNLSSRG